MFYEYYYSYKVNLYHEAKQKGKEEERVLPYLLFATISNIAVALCHTKETTLAPHFTGKYGYFKSTPFLIVTYAVIFCKYIITTALTTTLLHHYNSLMSLPELLATSWHNLGVTGDVLPLIICIVMERGEPMLEQHCWQDLWPHEGLNTGVSLSLKDSSL